MAEPSVWNKAAAKISSTQAASRFTKTPIKIINYDRIFEKLKELINGNIPVNTNNYVSGAYLPEDKQIEVDLHGLQPSYADLSNIIHHEDIHALLQQANIWHPQFNATDPTQGLAHRIASFFNPSEDKAIDAFHRGDRSGNSWVEVPAYVGAYNPKQLPGFSEVDRQDFINKMLPNLPAKVADTFMRIVKSHDVSQGF